MSDDSQEKLGIFGTLLGVQPMDRIGTTSSSPFSGSPTFDEIPFHVEPGCRPQLGTYAIVKSTRPDRVHYGRVTSGTEENPRADPTTLQQNKAYQVGQRQPRPGDLAPHVTRILTVQVLGEIVADTAGDGYSVDDPKELPATGQPVYTLGAGALPKLLNMPTDPNDGINLGKLQSGGTEVDAVLPVDALARQTTIVGKTGAGKSYAAGLVVEECKRLEIPVFSFDVLGDLVAATEELDGVNYKAGSADFKIPYSIIGLSEFISFVPTLTREQNEIVAMAYDVVYEEARSELTDTGSIAIGIGRLAAMIEQAGVDVGQIPVAGRAKRRVLAAYNRSTILTDEAPTWLEAVKTKPVVNVFVGHLPQRQRNLVVGAAARMLQTLRRQDQVPPFVLILDEAHHFLPSGGEETPSTSVIRELVRTARHDAIGVVLISQSPSSMDRQAFLTCNTRLVFALDPEDLRLVGGHLADMSESAIQRIPRMRRGLAVLTSAVDLMRHSIQVEIRPRKTKAGAPTPNLRNEAARWRQKNSQRDV
ncbi:MAG: ATP-binding protein [Chloroflexi bacterium]|nr:ATP-binding protein [Chloroflexota bacterium]